LGSAAQDSKSTVDQQTPESQVQQDPEVSFDDWMSNIDVNAHHFTTYVLIYNTDIGFIWCIEVGSSSLHNRLRFGIC